MSHINSNRYLIVQTAFLGDVVLSLSMAEYIKKQESDSQVIFLTTPDAKSIADACPFVDETIVFDKRHRDKSFYRLVRLGKKLKAFKFKAVFTPHRSLRSSLLTYLSGSKIRFGFDKNNGNFFYSQKVKYIANYHEIQRNLRLVREFWNDGGDQILLPTIKVAVKKQEYIALAPGSIWKTKRWPEEKWAELILHPYMKKKSMMLIGGRGDINTVEKILTLVDNHHPDIENRVGKDQLVTTFQNIAMSKLLISNDSAPQHIAVSVRTPVITIFGSTVTDFGFYPVGKHDSVVETDLALNCRPCGIHGKQYCRIKTFDCMMSISVEKVIQKIKDTLSRIDDTNYNY